MADTPIAIEAPSNDSESKKNIRPYNVASIDQTAKDRAITPDIRRNHRCRGGRVANCINNTRTRNSRRYWYIGRLEESQNTGLWGNIAVPKDKINKPNSDRTISSFPIFTFLLDNSIYSVVARNS